MKKWLVFATVFLSAGAISAQVTVAIDSGTKFQRIEGWGHGGGIFSNLFWNSAQSGIDAATTDSINYQYLDYVVHDLGLTGSRMWEVGPRIDGTGMDNGDCDSIDWTKFQARAGDSSIARYVLYFQGLVEANGFKTSFYSSPTYPTAATAFKPWVMNHPGERAQQIWANALWWKKFGIDINYDVIQNEPNGSWTAQLIADDIKALGPRLANLGLATKTQYAEAVAPQTDWNFITPLQNDVDFWKYVGRISYHNYGTADPYRANLRDFAKTLGITTAQTEMGNPTIDDIFNDIILGGVSYWEVGFSGNVTLVPSAGNISLTPSSTYFRMRQVIHYVRPGAVRIGVTSSDSLIRVIAFEKNGAITAIILANKAGQIANISGLLQGRYGVSQAAAGTSAFQELGIKTVGSDGMLSLSLGGAGTALTIYPYSGSNHSPTIISWGVSPGYVTAPVTTATLTVKANDAELDPITYRWRLLSNPPGSNPLLVSPTTASTSVSGLSVAGIYAFSIEVSDGVSMSSRKVYLQVLASSPQPMMGQAGFRFGNPYGLVFSAPGELTHANIELPVSSATLQVQIGDLANSDFTGRGKWILVSQPPGGSVKLDSTIYIYISIRAQVSNMVVAGDYIFQCNVTNPGHSDLTTRIICTVHPASSGPVISSIASQPAVLSLPGDSARLSASTSDPQGQLLRHWWAVKSTPAGAKPIFDHQGLPNSNVSGLSVPGTYVFTLRAFDDIHMATKDMSIIVNKASGGVKNKTSDGTGLTIFPNPITGIINIHNAPENLTSVTVMNVLGERVIEIANPHYSDFTIDLSKVLPGMYYARFLARSSVLVRKIIKE